MISPKKLENVLKKLKNGKGSPDQITADRFESIASRMFGEFGEIVVVDVLGYDFPGRLAVLFDGNGSESGGCNVLYQVQANRWAVCDANSIGLRMAQVAPSTAVRECMYKLRLCRSSMQMLDCFCCCKRQSCRESGRKKLWWYNCT